MTNTHTKHTSLVLNQHALHFLQHKNLYIIYKNKCRNNPMIWVTLCFEKKITKWCPLDTIWWTFFSTNFDYSFRSWFALAFGAPWYYIPYKNGIHNLFFTVIISLQVNLCTRIFNKVFSRTAEPLKHTLLIYSMLSFKRTK